MNRIRVISIIIMISLIVIGVYFMFHLGNYNMYLYCENINYTDSNCICYQPNVQCPIMFSGYVSLFIMIISVGGWILYLLDKEIYSER